MVHFLKSLRFLFETDRASLLGRKKLVHWQGRWMTVEAFLDERQFAMVVEVGPPSP